MYQTPYTDGNAYRVGAVETAAFEDRARAFLWKVHGWMAIGLGLTGVVAMVAAFLAVTPDGTALTPFGEVLYSPIVRFGSVAVTFGLVLALSFLQARLSPAAAGAMFLLYAAANGLWMSALFLVYTTTSIGTTFMVTAGMYGATSLYGLVTKRDLSGVGSFAFMGLIGLILASIVNFFVASTMLYWLITYAGVAIFVGLTAYDTQKIRQMGGMGLAGRAEESAAIQGALTLYLDFINLFLFLLRLLGRRR
jgi:FtsH-binding integral membrane protein